MLAGLSGFDWLVLTVVNGLVFSFGRGRLLGGLTWLSWFSGLALTTETRLLFVPRRAA